MIINAIMKRRERAFDLNSLGKASYANRSAIEKLVTHLRKQGFPEVSSRASQYRARKEICRTETAYGTLVQKVSVPLSKGGETMVSMQAPLPFFVYNCEHSESYARIVRDALNANPCSPATPWHIILYQDGVDPSDMGATHHTRSSCVWYWSIAEFGMYALSHEEVWGCVCTLRKSEYKAIEGDISGLLVKILKLFRGIHDIKLAGVNVVIGGTRSRSFADVDVFFGDEPALKEIFDFTGHAGTKPCPLCANVCLRKAMELYNFLPPMQTLACTEWNDLMLHSDASIKASVARMKDLAGERDAKRITAQEFDDRSGLIGWNHNPAHSALFGNKLDVRVASKLMFDWPHVYVHGGLADVEFGHFMKLLAKRGLHNTQCELKL